MFKTQAGLIFLPVDEVWAQKEHGTYTANMSTEKMKLKRGYTVRNSLRKISYRMELHRPTLIDLRFISWS